jgi:hypothetical protein
LEYEATVLRFDARGQPLGDFGDAGVQLFESPGLLRDLALQEDGRILVFGARVSDEAAYVLKRFEPDGQLDQGFADAGELVLPLEDLRLWYMLYDRPAGRVLVVGNRDAGGMVYLKRLWL